MAVLRVAACAVGGGDVVKIAVFAVRFQSVTASARAAAGAANAAMTAAAMTAQRTCVTCITRTPFLTGFRRGEILQPWRTHPVIATRFMPAVRRPGVFGRTKRPTRSLGGRLARLYDGCNSFATPHRQPMQAPGACGGRLLLGRVRLPDLN